MQRRILTINGGSSTIKFAAFRLESQPVRILAGEVERIGSSDAAFAAGELPEGENYRFPVRARDHREAAHRLMAWLAGWTGQHRFEAIGHRIVHGGANLDKHQQITPGVMEELRRAQPLDLSHLPREIALIEASSERFNDVVQIACLDTAFTRELPRVAQLLPIPRRYYEAGIRRLGFHGLSYAYLMEELRHVAGRAALGRVILAHLGSGASMTAMLRGAPVDTTMAFTPASGLMMATRPGDLDPGLLIHLMRTERLTPEQMDELVSHRCGLIAISESTADVRELTALRESDPKANEALELFCYQVKKWIGAYTAVLGGVDTVVFSGGIGERSPHLRARICEGLECLGIRLSSELNTKCAGTATVISAPDSAAVVRVLPTDEELMIARIVFGLIDGGTEQLH
jgi:acetate kinase